ncbi:MULTISPECIES: GH3 auxin-responsive promoter family protein [Hallella]|uniref:GH3 auxin-responsive promoter family protein n=1 Tax=Hallella faecis TaxID=2841596 RepID=A0ABV1FPB0_9BACT|nr:MULTISPECIES: GH3 auxin-responsive promoter family protein [Hallella]MBP6273235.1 GH3 auxin-responsive promoter family protein [Prevotella sp.]MBS7400066.1 GH3 auxin-responsive promoter family protein [Prevotella sp.]MBU0289441.1 GH3 auxin-responsive promoter family protein [Hallella faecis]MCI7433566.1 GH3 auxin-responsive promoter family protein [Prevotella sp.]MDD7145576.1 GH3 auxin-responsive promoter family protein [Hallella sp.]
MSLTKIVGQFFKPRQYALEKHYTQPEALQEAVLRHLLERGSNTEYGRNHLLSPKNSYEEFAKNVPINTYEELKRDIDRMRHGEADVLWPGQVQWYAKSSGTTNDKSKFIPVSAEGLHDIHYQGGKDVVTFYLRNNPNSRLFDGKSLILGGSHSPNYNVDGSLVGDLSAILIENINPLVNLMRVPRKRTALLSDFEVKRDRIAQECLHKNITNISGVPSWMLSVLVRVMELSGKKHLEEVWPNLEVFFHGGIAFTPYRSQYEQLITSSKMHYMETYNASEGFFGIQDDPTDRSMLLMLDYGVFYEFIPLEEVGRPDATVVPLEGVEIGRNYAMVITTSCGLWRYMIGDTVEFTSKRPYKFIITGRTKYFINAFGEELIMDNAEKGLAYACEKTGAQVLEYTAAPVYMDKNAKCRHQWLIEFSKDPDNLERFAQALDEKLQELNSDYEAKRSHNVTLQHLEVVKAKEGLFNDWLKQKGRLGGQHKVPRLSNSRKNMDELLEMNKG